MIKLMARPVSPATSEEKMTPTRQAVTKVSNVLLLFIAESSHCASRLFWPGHLAYSASVSGGGGKFGRNI